MSHEGTEPVAPRPFRPAQPPSLPLIVALIATVLLLVVLYLAGAALIVFGVGAVIAFMLRPIVERLEELGVSRAVGSLVTVVLVGVVAAIVVIGATATLVTQSAEFVGALPELLDRLSTWYASVVLPGWLREAIDAAAAAVAAGLVQADEGSLVLGLLSGSLTALSGLLSLLVLPFFVFYLLVDLPRITHSFRQWLPAQWRRDVEAVVSITARDVGLYIRARLILGGVMFVIVLVGTSVIGLIVGGPLGSLALFLAALAFAMELLPQVGPVLSYVPALAVALSTSLEAAVLVSVFYLVAFSIEGWILLPALAGEVISFSGATILLVIGIGFALGGIVGAVVSLPLAAVARDVFGYVFSRATEISQSREGAPA